MSKEKYLSMNFRQDSLKLVAIINTIVAEYQQQGYRLTVRQLYYQLVARDHIPNTERSYKNTVTLVNNARLAGLIDWEAIEDRTREFLDRPHWESGKEILQSSANQFFMDMWENQENRVFCIVEKEALAGVMSRTCHRWDVPMLAARGYPSASVLREFVQREFKGCTQNIVLLHLGDHDPSGIDMTRDLEARISLLSRDCYFEMHRIALNMDQIEELQPPPNPAKTTDSRFSEYQQQFGDESWELDALSPTYIDQLVTQHIRQHIDEDAWTVREQKIKNIKAKLLKVAENFEE